MKVTEQLLAMKNKIAANRSCLLSIHVFFLLTAFTLLMGTPSVYAYAVTLHVPDDYPTIQDAVNAADYKDYVYVAPGVYTGNGNRFINTLGKTIIIRGTGGAAETIIDLQGTGTAFIVNQTGGRVSIAGFTIKNGGGYLTNNGNPDDPSFYGGAIYVQDLSDTESPLINDCIIINNKADYGGGIYSLNASPTIQDTQFINNTSDTRGGGILFVGLGGFALPTVNSSIFRNNIAVTGNGGAISAESLIAIRSQFIENSANFYESQNGAFGAGGAIFVSGPHTIQNNTFVANSAYSGGAVRVDAAAASGTILHSSFYNNSATFNGGALAIAGTTTLVNSILWSNSCTITENGQQVSVSELPTDPDFWVGTRTLTVEQSDIEGGLAGIQNFAGTITSSGLTIDQEPLFALAEDLHLLSDSPCIDSGTATPPGGLPATDLTGNTRSVDGNGDNQDLPDMGAYEFVPNSAIAAVSPKQLFFQGIEGQGLPASLPISIRNSGSGTLKYTTAVQPETTPLLRAEQDTLFSEGKTDTITVYLDEEQWQALPPGTHYQSVQILDGTDNVTVLETIAVVIQKNRILRVGGNGADYNNLEEAISDAIDGDVVLVDDGTYYEGGLTLHNKTITLKSVNGPEFTIIDAENTTFGIEFTGRNSTILQGFTIQNGYATANGAGILIDINASPTILSCKLLNNNTDTSDGGGLYSRGTNVLIRNCEFIGNVAASDGGAIYSDLGKITIDNCTFANNQTGGGYGGGVYLRGKGSIINGCSFTGNTANQGGGGAYLNSNNAADTMVTNCIFSNNIAINYHGGGLFSYAQGVQVVNTIFTGNQTSNSTRAGGGAYTYLASLINCTFYNNTSGTGTSDSLYTTSGKVINSVFWEDAGTALYFNNSEISYTACSGSSPSGTENILLSVHPFVNPVNGDFHLNPATASFSDVVDTGTTINSLFSDQRGSLRPINGDSTTSFDRGAMEFSKFYGGIQGDLVTKSFSNLRIESPAIAVGYGYSIEWNDRDPFPFGDERIQQAGEYTINLALVNNFGRRIELGTYTKITTPLGYKVSYIFQHEHIGQWQLRLEMAEDPNQYILSDPVTIEYKKLNAYYYGTQISAPEGADSSLKPDYEDEGFVYWSETTRQLYAVGGPKSVIITWYADAERTIPFPTVAFVTMPPQPQIHIADSQAVPLMPPGTRFDSVELMFAENDASTAGSEFNASEEGWSVLLFRDSEGATPVEQEVFEVIRTLTWDNPEAGFPAERTTDIGFAVLPNQTVGVDDHDLSCGNGYVFFEAANIDAYGDNKAYDRASRQGAIFPVNVDFTGPISGGIGDSDDLLVIWYQKSTSTDICWPYTPVRYTAEWPTAPDTIYIDSGLGSGPLEPTVYGLLDNMVIYNQPDVSLPGFNPNEEHAAFFTAQGSTHPGIFPLRNDINRADTSAPYVLLKFIDPQTGEWNMHAWQVLATDGVTPFTYDTIAGNEINAPYPLNQFVYGPCAESYTSTPSTVINDKDSKMFSYRGDVDAGVHYFYKLQPGFYYDLDGDTIQNAADGTCIAWMDDCTDATITGCNNGSFDGTPVQATYSISWPDPVPTLFIGETLIAPKTQTGELVGLPEIGGQCQVSILYDDNGINASAKLIDPVTEYAVDYALGNPESDLPEDLKPKVDLSTGRWIFTNLPYHIQERLTYDPIASSDPNAATKGMLKLKGIYSSGVGEPFLLLNVLTDREIQTINDLTTDTVFEGTLTTLNGKGLFAGSIKNFSILKDSELKALTAGDAAGTGYVTLAFNNHKECAAPTMLSVIKVDCGLYRGDLKVIESTNPFEEKVTLHHNGDFGGNSDDRAFQWRYLRADFPGDPDLPTGPDDTSWLEYEPQPNFDPPGTSNPDGTMFYNGAVDTVIQGSGEQLLPDKWFSVRYHLDGVCANSYSDWTPPQLYEGWIKRVMKKINLFDQKVTDFHTTEVNDIAGMITLAGQRYEGDIALSDDPEHLQNLGIIETYETLLNRGLSLVSFDSQDLNMALLFASNRLADLYMLLGNEAYGDAADPTIGFSTESGQYGSEASSIFTFQNQVDSLLEEELTLLRGRDRTGVRPFYNHLIWNFTLGDGEVAYKENYNISDQDDDGDVDEYDAMIQFPQGHGDAWGYYLSAMKKYYLLLKNPLYTWIPQAENILVAGVPVKVDYRDERKFAAAAAARAKTGAEIVNLTYRDQYTEDPEGQWQGYKDPDQSRAWGVDGWAKRAGQGALFDWVVGNSILPSEYGVEEQTAVDQQTVFDLIRLSYTPGNSELTVSVNGQLTGSEAYTETSAARVTFNTGLTAGDEVRFQVTPAYGIEKVDRISVTELWDIVGSFNSIEAEVDKANNGLNPLGLAKNAIPFDIDPQLVAGGQTHFEQIYSRAIDAMNNAIVVFNHANQSTQMLRHQQDTLANFQRNIENMEADYNNRLIEIYGYPYPDDCGPNKTYTTDECQSSPDLYHFMYVDASELMGEGDPATYAFDVVFKETGIDAAGALQEEEKDVTFHISTDSRFGIIKPAEWLAARKAPGEIQLTRSEMLQTRGRFERGLLDYDNLLNQIENQADLIATQYNVNLQEISVLNLALQEQISLNSQIQASRDRQLRLRAEAKLAAGFADAAAEAFSGVNGLIVGVSSGAIVDIFAGARSLAKFAGMYIADEKLQSADSYSMSELGFQQAKEVVSAESNIRLTTLRSDFAITQQLLQLENLIRTEATLRHDIYVLEESLQQSANRYLAVLAKGDRLMRDRLRFRQQTAAQVADYRYKDMSFRIFRNESLQKYRAQFDMAAKYVYLAAKAYDYETTLLDYQSMAGQSFFTDLVKQRSIGTIEGGMPLTGSGLADPMKRMWQNFQVLKPQLGINNPQVETNRFSLRQELFRVRMDTASNTTWRQVLNTHRVDDLWDVPEFRRYCRPFAAEGIAEPGIVIPFSTSITAGLNFFKWPLGGGDSYYSATNYATKVRSVGVWFSNYNSVGLAQTPRVYLVPVGEDVLRTPSSNTQEIRTWQVVDQKLPVPFPIETTEMENDPSWIPSVDTIFDEMFAIRKHSDFRAYHDSGYLNETEMAYDTRLIGRSVWNSEWLLIIPGRNLLYDGDEGLDTFVDGPLVLGGTDGERTGFGISDIKIFFETYGYSGN